MLHSCGWLEGGLVSSLEKFVMDADQLGVLHSIAAGVDLSVNGQALEAIHEVGPGGHFLGCNHTQNNFKDAFWKSNLLDYKPFETWSEEGGLDTVALASKRVKYLLDNYEKPKLDPSIDEKLCDFITRKKQSEPDKSY